MPGVQVEFQGVLRVLGQVGPGDGQIIANKDADVVTLVTEAWLWSLAGLVGLADLDNGLALALSDLF